MQALDPLQGYVNTLREITAKARASGMGGVDSYLVSLTVPMAFLEMDDGKFLILYRDRYEAQAIVDRANAELILTKEETPSAKA